MSHTDMGIVGATTDTFILFENGVRRNLSLSETLSGWRLTEAMLLFNEGSFQAHWLGGYAWVKMGFRPTDDAWREMKREAYGFMVQHVSVLRRKLDVTELMTRIEAGGPKIALTLATLGVEVPSRQIQDRSGPKPMPFGKVFFLEVASPWSGVLDLRDAEVIKIVESYRKKK
jgi:hypothetical protein